VVVLTSVLASMAGYAFARHKFLGRNLVFYLFVTGLTLPFQSIMIPLFYQLADWNLIGSYWAIILPQTAVSLPFGIFIMRAFFQGLPVSLEEAARIDGCNEWRVFRKVILPLATPGMVALGIFTFVSAWNSFLIPLIFGQRESRRTVTVGLMFFQGEFTTNFALTMAGSTLISLPILLMYIIFQRQFISGLTAGAVKG
jgi:raffinose/stachyose/melibiose transport system permease protein